MDQTFQVDLLCSQITIISSFVDAFRRLLFEWCVNLQQICITFPAAELLMCRPSFRPLTSGQKICQPLWN